jgi:hypothetical protein
MKKPTPERLCWRMTFLIESGRNARSNCPKMRMVLAIIRPNSILCVIRQQSPERGGVALAEFERDLKKIYKDL